MKLHSRPHRFLAVAFGLSVLHWGCDKVESVSKEQERDSTVSEEDLMGACLPPISANDYVGSLVPDSAWVRLPRFNRAAKVGVGELWLVDYSWFFVIELGDKVYEFAELDSLDQAGVSGEGRNWPS